MCPGGRRVRWSGRPERRPRTRTNISSFRRLSRRSARRCSRRELSAECAQCGCVRPAARPPVYTARLVTTLPALKSQSLQPVQCARHHDFTSSCLSCAPLSPWPPSVVAPWQACRSSSLPPPGRALARCPARGARPAWPVTARAPFGCSSSAAAAAAAATAAAASQRSRFDVSCQVEASRPRIRHGAGRPAPPRADEWQGGLSPSDRASRADGHGFAQAVAAVLLVLAQADVGMLRDLRRFGILALPLGCVPPDGVARDTPVGPAFRTAGSVVGLAHGPPPAAGRRPAVRWRLQHKQRRNVARPQLDRYPTAASPIVNATRRDPAAAPDCSCAACPRRAAARAAKKYRYMY
eukprot:SAG31_NODE_1357_length_8647_cov_8.257838_2_plen_351_part_00